MEIQGGEFNITEQFSVKYPVTNMIFPNKTLILLTRQRQSSSQQMALLAAMAFIGGIVAGLLIRCLYYGIVKYFLNNMDQLVSQHQRQEQGNVNSSYVNDQPPDYVTVVTQTSVNPELQGRAKVIEEWKTNEDVPPPAYISIVSNFGRVKRSAST